MNLSQWCHHTHVQPHAHDALPYHTQNYRLRRRSIELFPLILPVVCRTAVIVALGLRVAYGPRGGGPRRRRLLRREAAVRTRRLLRVRLRVRVAGVAARGAPQTRRAAVVAAILDVRTR